MPFVVTMLIALIIASGCVSIYYSRKEEKKQEEVGFDDFCCKLLLANGYKDVEICKTGKENAAVLIATSENGAEVFVYCVDSAIEVDARIIEEAAKYRAEYNMSRGIVLTNNSFTPSASEKAVEYSFTLQGESYIANIAAAANLGTYTHRSMQL